jgi:PTH1 family peptidyl-tRNA hydrolase
VVEYLIAGLGNPGSQYDNTRHNAGFRVLDELARRNGVKKIKKLKFQSTYALVKALGGRNARQPQSAIPDIASGGSLVLLKPQTFMNRSGQAVRDAAAFYKLLPGNIIVVLDETALPLGRLRIRASGSDGGHNGMKDILYHLQSAQFPRVRIGVGSPPHPDTDLADWVLMQLADADRKILDEAVIRAADAVECIVAKGIEAAMSFFNQSPPYV